ncbi:hypothetical protein [Streptomyces sp. 1222.5]|uniref:hypothetical protein n=1 Tax=Streptomyces sp. 1222.5 TaxID=1881026 RepID=UPI003EB72995
MAKKKPPTGPVPDSHELIIRSAPFTEDGSERLARHQRQAQADQRGRAQLRARARFIGATGGRPRRPEGDE